MSQLLPTIAPYVGAGGVTSLIGYVVHEVRLNAESKRKYLYLTMRSMQGPGAPPPPDSNSPGFCLGQVRSVAVGRSATAAKAPNAPPTGGARHEGLPACPYQAPASYGPLRSRTQPRPRFSGVARIATSHLATSVCPATPQPSHRPPAWTSVKGRVAHSGSEPDRRPSSICATAAKEVDAASIKLDAHRSVNPA